MKRIYHNLTENSLITLLRNGDQDAFSEIFNRYHHFLLIYAHKLSDNEDERDDLVQDVFLKAWENRERFDESKSLFNYLKVSMRNSFLDKERNKTVHTTFKNYLLSYPTDSLNTTDEYLAEKELIVRLEEIANKLPGKMGKVFLMTHFEHYSEKEIAYTLHISEKTVRNLLSQAVNNMKLRLGLAIVLGILLS